jgi:dihydroorotase
MQHLDAFASHNGADFYGLPRTEEKITLVRKEASVPAAFTVGELGDLKPIRAGETVQWCVEGQDQDVCGSCQ